MACVCDERNDVKEAQERQSTRKHGQRQKFLQDRIEKEKRRERRRTDCKEMRFTLPAYLSFRCTCLEHLIK